ncbi:hypothetical protein O0L34_g10415 [Tuta absoluta]|nr:hypothetical protein O0L34_g10415 [Tuta absoluta]
MQSGFDLIFNTVLNSDASHIEEFVLVTVDELNQHVVTTRDRDVFKKSLSDIGVRVVEKICPRMTMTGIEVGLKASRPGSLMYVLTDASPRDIDISSSTKKLIKLADKTQTKVSFVLSGNCLGDDTLYRRMAKLTSGQLFNLNDRSDLEEVMKYVSTQVKCRNTVILHKDFTSAETHQVHFQVDCRMTDIVISVSGKEYNTALFNPGGGFALFVPVAHTSMFTAMAVPVLTTGIYTLEMNSTGKSSVVVTTNPKFHFDYIFHGCNTSYVEPNPGEEYAVSINLLGDLKHTLFDELLIMDEEDSELFRIALKDRENFVYDTVATFAVPSVAFKLAIKGRYTQSLLESCEIIRFSPLINKKIDSGAAQLMYAMSIWMIVCFSLVHVIGAIST